MAISDEVLKMLHWITNQFETFPKPLSRGDATGARWSLAMFLLTPLVAAEFFYDGAIALAMLAFFMAIASVTCTDLDKLSEIMPPPKTARGRRVLSRNLRSFGDFMAIWMRFLSHLVAVAICARIISATVDNATCGRTRRWLFGYEQRPLGEPWPDVLGVTVVIVVCVLFMCGLEESMLFMYLLLGTIYTFLMCFVVYGMFKFNHGFVASNYTVYQLFSAAAPLSYTFSLAKPEKTRSLKKNIFYVNILPACALIVLSILFGNLIRGNTPDVALPLMTMLEVSGGIWYCSSLAALIVANVCLALTELCPLLFKILVTLASTEWKVLTRSMTYESTSTGSPVLAVFTAGSLAAILAFACPTVHMIALMNASHLLGITIQALQFTILRCVPTADQIGAGDIEYKRLGKDNPGGSKASASRIRLGLWFNSTTIRHTKTLESIKSKMSKETEERECLLLDEYSGCPAEENEPIPSKSGVEDIVVDVAVLSDAEASDQESSGDDSTDIDAVVKEYRDRIKVVTSVPDSKTPTTPSMRGARWAAVGTFIQLSAAFMIGATFCCHEDLKLPLAVAAVPVWIIGVTISAMQPAHDLAIRKGQSIEGPITLMAGCIFLTPILIESWPAITLFAFAGLVIYARCERWCGILAVKHARSAMEGRKLGLAAVPLTGARIAHVDTVYVAR